MKERHHVRSRVLGATGLVLLTLLFASVLSSAANAQGPGLFKDGQKILEFEQTSDSTFLAKDLPPDVRAKLDGSPFAKMLPQRPAPGGGKVRGYFSLVQECNEIAARLTSQDVAPKTTEDTGRLAALVDSVGAAHRTLLAQFEQVRRDLESGKLPSEKLGRHLDMIRTHTEIAERLQKLLDEFRLAHTSSNRAGEQGVLLRLQQHFAENPTQVEPLGLPAQPLPVMSVTPVIAPIVQGAPPPPIPHRPADTDKRRSDPADLQETIDVRFTPEIVALAASLDHSPVKIFNYVRDNCTFEAYLGSRKGGLQTLHHKSGNDTDQASLLIALLRVSQIPARYAKGVVEVPLDRVANWLGFTDGFSAANYLATAGFSPTLYAAPGGYVLRFNRTWVEGWIPFNNYRGAVNDTTGQMWVPLDPAFKQYTHKFGFDLPTEIGFNAESFVEQYYLTVRPQTPVEMLRETLLGQLPALHPGATYDDLLPQHEVIRETDGILAGTLPYKLVTDDGHYSTIADADRYKIRFHIYGSGTSLDYTADLPAIAEKQVTISYIGATAADQQIIDNAGGIFAVTTPWLVDLKPVLKIDGCAVATGTGQVIMGLSNSSDMHFTTPAGDFNEIPVIYNSIVAGNYQGVGIDTHEVQPSYLGTPETSCPESRSGWEAHQLALTYLAKVDRGGDEAADLMHLMVINDVSEAIVENSVTVWTSGGVPSQLDWTGMIVDADRKIIGPFSVDGQDEACAFMRLAGADGSTQENRLFEDRFNEEAVSTIKILGLAGNMGIPVCTIRTSIAADCPGFNHPQYVRNAVNAALAAGHEVIIPRSPVTYYEWTGTGYIDLDPATCAAGYIIAGGQSGGATVQVWEVPWFVLWLLGIQCERPSPNITVLPASPGDLYCADSWALWTFVVPNIDYYGRNSDGSCAIRVSAPGIFIVWLPINVIASIWGPGDYVFTAGGPGPCAACAQAQKTVTILKVGIDASESRDYLCWNCGTSSGNARITTKLEGGTGSGAFTLQIKDGGTVIKTVVNAVSRGTGTYVDVWDGTTDAGPHAAPKSYTVRSEWNVGGVTCSAEHYPVVVPEVKLYRNSECTDVLDDWPAAAGSLRSPKYIFGKEESIYLEVTGPTDLGPNDLEAQVTSQSDPTGVTLKLSETIPGRYRNTAGEGELLRLRSTSGEDSPSDFIKVVDEEVLTFTIKADGLPACAVDVMVDRGEFATATARSYDSRLPNPPDRTPIWLRSANEFVHDINTWLEFEWPLVAGNLNWWDVGNVRGADAGTNVPSREFVQNAGQNRDGDLEADVFYSHSHGNATGVLAGTRPRPGHPGQEVSDIYLDPGVDLGGAWNDDVDWAIIKACSALNHTGAGRALWQAVLTHGRPAHGVLGFENDSASDYQDYVDDFFDEIGARHTLVTSWINANTMGGGRNQPYAAVYHSENAADVIRKADEGQSMTADVTTANFLYTWRDVGGTTGNTKRDEDPLRIERFVARWRDRDVAFDVPIAPAGISYPPVRATIHRFDIGRLRQGFDLVREWESGQFRLSADLDLSGPEVSLDQARATLERSPLSSVLPAVALSYSWTPIRTVRGDGSSTTIAYQVGIQQEVAGLASVGEGIAATVQDGRMSVISGSWHDLVTEKSGSTTLAPFGQQAMQRSLDGLTAAYDLGDEPPAVKLVRPAYYVGHVCTPGPVPAIIVWEVEFTNGCRVFYDPATDQAVDDAASVHASRRSLRP